MKMYKGFNKDMTCKGFQYEEGKTYEVDHAKLCAKGFHACEDPLDCFRYHEPGSSVYHEVDLEVIEFSPYDTKRFGNKITIGRRLSFTDIFKAHQEYVQSHCAPAIGDTSNGKENAFGGDYDSVAAGKGGYAVTGNLGSAIAGAFGSVSAGHHGNASAGSSGNAAVGEGGIASAGFFGNAVAGYQGSAIAGYRGCALAGDFGNASAGSSGNAVAGKGGIASAGSGGSSSVGEDGLASCFGGKAKGGIGAVLSLSEVDDEGRNLSCACAIVDGETIKADTWYKCVNGELVET